MQGNITQKGFKRRKKEDRLFFIIDLFSINYMPNITDKLIFLLKFNFKISKIRMHHPLLI